MSDIFEMRKKMKEAKNGPAPSTDQPQPQAHVEALDQYQEPLKDPNAPATEPPVDPKVNTNLQGANSNLEGNQEMQQGNENAVTADAQWGPQALEGRRDLFTDPDSWSPEYTMRPWLAEVGNSVMRGVGNHWLKGTGDMLQVAGSFLPGGDISKGNIFSRYLQTEGTEFAAQYQQFIPEELRHENLDFASAMNPKFWSTHVAELIPQLAEFIMLSKGGSALVRGAGNQVAKQALKSTAVKKLASRTALNEGVAMSGHKVVGKIISDQGLTSASHGVLGAIGGGYAGNKLSGMLNAAQVVNQYKDVEDDFGNKIYDEETLSELAASTMRNNSTWLAVDMASWGLTYGGLWKHANKLNPVAKGAKLRTIAEQTKIGGKVFQYDMAPILKSVGKLAKKASFEGAEETLQETWEEWAVKKAELEVIGKPMEHDSYWDFYSSKENRGTLVISAAVGGLGGAAFNIRDLINKKADENYRLYDAFKNFAEVTNKNGTEAENTAQEMFTRDTIARIVLDENTDRSVYEDFAENLIANKNIEPEEKARLDEMYDNFEAVKAKAKKLNVKGMKALLQANSQETYFGFIADKAITDAKEKIDTYKGMRRPDNAAEIDQKIADTEAVLKTQLEAATKGQALAIQTQENLILGKAIQPITVERRYDEFGNEIVTGGLSDAHFREFTKEGEKQKAPMKFKGPTKESLSSGLKGIIEKLKAPFMKKDPDGKKSPTMDPKEAEVVEENQLSNDEQNEIENEFGVALQQNEDGTYEAITEGDSDAELKARGEAEAKINAIMEQRKAAPAQKTDAEAEAIMEASVIPSKTESIDNATYENYVKTNQLPQKVINDIAKALAEKEGLSNRQQDIFQENSQAVKQAVVKYLLGTTAEVKPPPTQDNNNDEDNDNNPPTDPDPVVDEDPNNPLTEDEKGFIEDEGGIKQKGDSMAQDGAKKTQAAQDNWKPGDVKNAENLIGQDARAETEKNKKITAQNIQEAMFIKSFLRKLRMNSLVGGDMVSKNEIDNYLNLTSTYNLKGPSEIDKMVAVNHQLKRMFPNGNPAQAIIVRNMFDAIGSVGLGHSIGMTIFIDEKVWDQDWVYMHELSHLYMKLARDTPEVEAILKMAMADKALVAKIKERYDDYTYYADEDGNMYTKKELTRIANSKGQDPDQFFKDMISEGVIGTVPLEQQELLLGELFAHALQGPLSDTKDKIFADKEQRRQVTVKKFWGLMRKKGKIIQEENGVEQMLRVLGDSKPLPGGSLKDMMMNTFKAVTKGIELDGIGMDARAGKMSKAMQASLDNIAERKANIISDYDTQEFKEAFFGTETESDFIADMEEAQEETGSAFGNKEFDQQVKGATRLIKKFGIIYNKSLRQKFLKDNVKKRVDYDKQDLFRRHLFEQTMFNLAKENKVANVFIHHIENSSLEEVQVFNRYLDKIYKNEKLDILTSMHLVFSNATHIVGTRNTIDDNMNMKTVNSLSQREKNIANTVLGRLQRNLLANTPDHVTFKESYHRIRLGQENKQDYFNVIRALTGHDFNMEKVLENGYATYQGVTIPLEVLIAGFIKKGKMFNKDKFGNINPESIYAWNARPLVEALINTNRKYSPLSMVENAEGNMEQAKITNNNLTNEVDGMIEFLSPDVNGNRPTKEQFLERYSHIGYKNRNKKSGAAAKARKMGEIYDSIDPKGSRIVTKKKFREAHPDLDAQTADAIYSFLSKGKKSSRPNKEAFLKEFDGKIFQVKASGTWVANQLLEGIYDNFQKGILPTISQDHGIMDISNNNGSLYKNSTALEQGIKDFIQYVTSTTNENGTKNSQAIMNLGAFSDSPRKFMMNMQRIDYTEIFDSNGKFHANKDKDIVNSILNLYQEIFPGDPASKSRDALKKELVKSMKRNADFFEQNGEEMSKIKQMQKYFKKDEKGKEVLNKEGRKMVAEYTINSVAQGLNTAEVFMPGVKGSEIAKRMKANSSPVFSVKNPNLRTEFMFFADEIVNNSESGTDSGMYILEEQAKKLQKLGRGVFEMNHGFKILNSHVEKTNPNFKGKLGYLKGFTTIVKPGHAMYPAMKSRMDKYDAWHLAKFGKKPSMDLSDGSPNHLIIAIPQSSDKSNFYDTKLTEKVDGKTLTHTETGAKLTPTALSQNHDALTQIMDEQYYDAKGDFVGLDSYNFGPQQLMDRVTKTSNTPVQFINSIIVNAMLNGEMPRAMRILELINNQRQKKLAEIVKDLSSGNINKYREIIENGLNKEDMNQAQRLMIEEGSSMANVYVNEIVVNQLAKTILRAGNKLQTPGTNAHQKPDTGYNLNSEIRLSEDLKGYEENGDGTLIPAGMVLPKHMSPENGGNIETRVEYTMDNQKDKLDQLEKQYKKQFTKEEALEALKSLTISRAKARARTETGDSKNYEKYMGSVRNKQGIEVGYFVRGQTLIASRVPGHGPSSTGIYEAVAFDNSEGNQVMIASGMNDIMGSDNDGDSLFIQTRGDAKEFADWNQAFNMITEYWTSVKMKDQVRTQMEFKDVAESAIDEIKKKFPLAEEKFIPFSPEARRRDYNNTMVAKRNVGPIFNLHKIANMLAAYETEMKAPVTINGRTYSNFKDVSIGKDSRNQMSAVIANIILDNAKHGYADALGFDENNMAQAVLMINMGIPLTDVGLILNSAAGKLWSEKNRNNSSMFHAKKKPETLVKEMYWELLKKAPPAKGVAVNLNVDTKDANLLSQQENILALFSHLGKMNSELQKITGIMSGHNKIHVNPLVLEKQLADYREMLHGVEKGSKTLTFSQQFIQNPDLQNYEKVASETLKHTKRLNPVYRHATNKVLTLLDQKMGGLTSNEIEMISQDLLKFNTSRLIGMNNISKQYAENLLDPKHPESIFRNLELYLNPLKAGFKDDTDNMLKKVSDYKNSILFRRALNVNLAGDNQYVSANTSFVDDSFNKEERDRARQEFEDLPTRLQDDLILYDLITHGWKGPQSMAPFFGKETMASIDIASDTALMNKNNTDAQISQPVLKALERTMALKHSMKKSNAFPKVYLKGNARVDSEKNGIVQIGINKEIQAAIKTGEYENGMYINLRNSNTNTSALYEIEAFTHEELSQIQNERGKRAQEYMLLAIAKGKIKIVPNTLSSNPEIDIALITDKNVGPPLKSKPNYEARVNMDAITLATLTYEEKKAMLQEEAKNSILSGVDAREDFDAPLFSKTQSLTRQQFEQAMEYKPLVSENVKTDLWNKYVKAKIEANAEAKKVVESFKTMPVEDLLSAYQKYGDKDVYAYSVVLTPLVKELAHRMAASQQQLWKDKKVDHKAKGFDGKDVSKLQAQFMTGSTIPSNHPAAQSMARMLESEYKKFTSEKRKYISEMNKLSDALYKEKLGYGSNRYGNILKKIRDVIFTGKHDLYQALYGNMVIREEVRNADGKLTYDFKLRTPAEMEANFANGTITKAEKDFYDFFRKTTTELMPEKVKKNKREDYIPHTSMSRLEAFSARGFLGLMVTSKNENDAINDVKMKFTRNGETKTMNFASITDVFKSEAAGKGRNDINTIMEYRALKKKAKGLLASGKNEDGSEILYSSVEIETALGFGAINRFTNNRSVKAEELPSMDLNKALGDYIHATLFVNGNKNFQGMERLQGYVDGVIAFNRENNLANMNTHVQTVWKDYFIKGKRQTSFLGEKADNVIRGLTRLNLFYALGYQANKNTMGLYAVGNILVGKYHNVKELGGKAWLKGELKFWGLDNGFEGGIDAVLQRRKRMANIMKNLNFMEINVYDEVNLEKKQGLDKIISDIALGPMILSERWIQQVHMIGMLSEEELNRFDDNGNYKDGETEVSTDRLIQLEDRVKASHGRGYQPTDQRAVQMYSWGNMMLQFSKFLPTMIQDRFAKADVNIYGQEHIGSLRAVSDMVRYVVTNPKEFVEYRKRLSPEMRDRLDSGLKGMALSSIISLGAVGLGSETANELYWDANYYFNHGKLANKMVPPAIQSTNNLIGGLFN